METIQRLAVFAAGALVLAGCDAQFTRQPGGGFSPPAVYVGTPGGNFPIFSPPGPIGPPAAPNLAAPPGLGGAAAPLPQPVGGWQDGTYDGVATLLENDLGDCAFRFSMTNMHVKNGTARFSYFHGRISPDGGVRMQYGAFNWMIGRFQGDHFSGTYTNRYCTYTMSLDRVGP